MGDARGPSQRQVGFNHNLKHQGRLFHVQTEDSGLPRAEVTTHLFLGGNILASARSTYTNLAAVLPPGDLAAAIRSRMEEQHKGMLKSLASGQRDAEIARWTGGDVYQPGHLAGGQQAADLLIGGDGMKAAPVVPVAPYASQNPYRTPTAPPVAGAGSVQRIDELILAHLVAHPFER